MKKRPALWAGAAVAAAAAIALWFLMADDAPGIPRPMAYVACGAGSLEPTRVYRVDLLAGRLLDVSGPIPWTGRPGHLAHDPVFSRLYLVSDLAESESGTWPVTVIRADGTFDVIGRFTTNHEGAGKNKANEDGSSPYGRQHEIYNFVVSPDGSELFVNHGGVGGRMTTAEWDAHTGNVLRELPAIVRSNYTWSPDGDYAVYFWPSSKSRVRKYGKFMIEERPAGYRAFDRRAGRNTSAVYLEDNQGMHPPWGKIDKPLIYQLNEGRIVAYNRDTGETISDISLRNIAGKELKFGYFFDALADGKRIAMSASQRIRAAAPPNGSQDFAIQGYVVLIDVTDQRIVQRIQVGGQCTAPVVAYE